MPYELGLPSFRVNPGQRYSFLWSGIFLLFYILPVVMSFPVHGSNMTGIYAKLALDEIYYPDQYAFNVSCDNCFNIM
jgi:hypothetical protein